MLKATKADKARAANYTVFFLVLLFTFRNVPQQIKFLILQKQQQRKKNLLSEPLNSDCNIQLIARRSPFLITAQSQGEAAAPKEAPCFLGAVLQGAAHVGVNTSVFCHLQ